MDTNANHEWTRMDPPSPGLRCGRQAKTEGINLTAPPKFSRVKLAQIDFQTAGPFCYALRACGPSFLIFIRVHSCPFAVVSIRNVRLAFAPLLFLVRHYSSLFLHRATTWFRPPGFLLPGPQRVGARTQGNPSDDQSGMAVWAGLRRRRRRALGSTGHGAS